MTTINIKMMKEEAFLTLKKNYKDVYENILKHPSDSSWLIDYLGFEPYEIKKYTIEDFELKNSDNYNEVSLDNGIILYDSLKNLPRYILCDNRFWAWITFEKAYKQAQQTTKLKNAEVVYVHWLTSNSRRYLMLGVISRSYFKTEVSIDCNRDDKYELTKMLFNNSLGPEIYRAITYRNIGMLKQVSLSIIQCFNDINNEFGEIVCTREIIRSAMKDASKIGSVMLIDDMDYGEIYHIIYNKAKKRILNNNNNIIQTSLSGI